MKERLKLAVIAASGHAAWWTWVLRDDAGAVIEQSSTQFRLPADAESHGRARIAMLAESRRAGFGERPWHSV